MLLKNTSFVRYCRSWQISAKSSENVGACSHCWISRSYRTTKDEFSIVAATLLNFLLATMILAMQLLRQPTKPLLLVFWALARLYRPCQVVWSGHGYLRLMRRVATVKTGPESSSSCTWLVVPLLGTCWKLFKVCFGKAGNCVSFFFKKKGALRPQVLFEKAHCTVCGVVRYTQSVKARC